MNQLKRISLYIFFGLLAYMPLHIFLSTWLGSVFGLLDFLKVLKDIFLVLGFTIILLATSKKSLLEIIKNKISMLILAYVFLTVLLALIKPTDTDAEILGVVYNTRFFMMFLYGWLLTKHYKKDWLVKNAVKLVLAVAVAVGIFGVLQYAFMSASFLEHFGYSRANGVLPAFFIDNKPDLERVMATLRDPNSYGSYLIIISSLATALYIKAKKQNQKTLMSGILILSLLNLFLTFSRSALIGAILALVALAWSSERIQIKSLLKKYYLLVIILLISVGSTGVFLKDSYLVKNIIFHADEATVLEDPNQLRTRFFTESVDAIVQNPLGYGPGTAGLASIRNDDKTVLNENYYLQVAYEVGVIGLVIFLSILVLVGYSLYLDKTNTYALALLAALVGLIFTNLLVHIWSNEAVAYTWWGLAGLLFAKRLKA